MARVVIVQKEVARRKIRGTYVPGNVGKEEAYARINEGESPAAVLEDFKRKADELVREENRHEAERAAEAAKIRQHAKSAVQPALV